MDDFSKFMARVLEPVEMSCGSRGCHVEKDGAWNLKVVTDHDIQAVLEEV